MAYLGNPAETAKILKKYDFHFRKKYGQNFLIDDNILKKIVSSANINNNDFVLEIGPGIGSLTQHLCENARHVLTVEIDEKLIPVLKYTLNDYNNVTLINDDILKLDIKKVIKKYNGDNPIKVVANLPYYITTPIIMGLFESHIPMHNMTVMVQKEVALRMSASPSTPEYGALTLATKYYSDSEIVANVPPNCFIPKPNVGSAVINLDCHKKNPVYVRDEEFMFKLIKAAFNQRRKTLQNALNNYKDLDLSKDEISEALQSVNLPPTVRGEALSLEQFAALSDHFCH